MTTIDIYIDFKSPATYLTLAPTRELLEKTGVKATWHIFNTRLTAVPAEKADENKGEKHRRVRALARREVHRLYAEVQDLPMVFSDQPFEAKCALSVLTLIDKDQDTFIDAAFEAYWRDQQDLDNPEVVAALLEALKLDIPVPDLQTTAQIIDETSLAAQNQGVIEAPAYVVAGQVFIGREHLPWIEELLTETISP